MNQAEKNNCKLGDLLEIKEDIETSPWEGEKAELVKKGSVYKTVNLVGAGWDLELVRGSGPRNLRILNSLIPQYTLPLACD
jgi:hypothetical protein